MLAHGYLPLSRIMALDKGDLTLLALKSTVVPWRAARGKWCCIHCGQECTVMQIHSNDSMQVDTRFKMNRNTKRFINIELHADQWKQGEQWNCGRLWHGWSPRGVRGSRWSHQDLSFWPNNTLLPSSSWSPFLLLESPCSNMLACSLHFITISPIATLITIINIILSYPLMLLACHSPKTSLIWFPARDKASQPTPPNHQSKQARVCSTQPLHYKI